MARRPNATLPPTPLRLWREREDVTYDALAKRAGLSKRTVLRAAAGDPVDPASAAALERETGIPAATFTAGAKPAKASRAPASKPGREPGTPSTKNPRVRARILLEADRTTDEAIAKKHGISTRTIERWRADLDADPQLARAWRSLQQRIEDAFVGDAAGAFRAVAKRIEQLAEEEQDIRALTLAVEKLGDVLVQARGLPRVEDDEDDDGIPSLDREGDAPPQDAEGDRSERVH